ncbi:radical SAM protein, partial [Gemmatimonadota bacterium]
MRHLYIHVPFCARRCIYCDFAIAVRREIPGAQYVNAIVGEHEHRMAVGEWEDAALETLYLGGGTPSLLPSERIAELLRHFFRSEGAVGDTLEVTIEANPDD